MKKYCLAICLAAAILFAAGSALSQDQMIYPSQGQDQDQMDRDRFECHRWATEQSGFDPTQAPQAQAAPDQQQQPSTGRSAVKGGGAGAAVGAGIGAITGGGAGKGAAIGGALGGATGAARGSERKRQSREQQAQESAGTEQKRAAYNRAFEACMEGRGYTVK